MKIKGIFENFFGKKEEEIQQTTEIIEEKIQPIKEEKIKSKEKTIEEKNKNLTEILSSELKKTKQINVRFNEKTIELIKNKIKRISSKKNIQNSEMVNFIVAYFLQDERNKEPIRIISENPKRYKISFKLSQEEIKYIFIQSMQKGINIDESCFQILQQNGISKNAKNQIYKLLMSEIHGLSNTQEEKKFLENLKELREINQKIIELKNFAFYNYLSGESLKDKFEEIVEEIAKMSEPIKQISSFLRRI